MTFDDEHSDSAYEYEFDFPSITQSDEHTVELVPGDYTGRGRLYAVMYKGKVLIDTSYDPEFDACRKLLELGIKGKLTTYRGDLACMILDIDKAAQLRTSVDKEGTPIFKRI